MTVLGIYSWSQLWSMGHRRGAESFYLSLSAFVRHGHELHVVAPGAEGMPTEEDLDGIHIHRLPAGLPLVPRGHRDPLPLRIAERAVKYAGFQLFAGWKAWRLAREIRPDAVVAFGAFAVPAAYAVARRLGIPNVTRLFGQWLADCYDNRLKYYANFPEILAFKTPTSALVLHDDGSNGEEMAAIHGVPRPRFFYWKNGVDPDLYRPGWDGKAVREALGIEPHHVLLFCVARMHREKHLERAIRAMPEVLREEPDVRLLLVGDGDERTALERVSRDLGVDHAVRFAGPQPREDLHKYFNTGDIFLSLADRTNGGNPTVEAMFCARCVMVLDTGGTAKLVENGRTGIVIPPDRLHELPARILEVVRDAPLRRRLGEAAREWIAPRVPTIAERQRMEVDVVERAVAERKGTPGGARDAHGPRAAGPVSR